MDQDQAQEQQVVPPSEDDEVKKGLAKVADVLARQQGPGEAANNGPVELFRYSSWIHVGPESESCEDVNEETGEVNCGNPLHFHGWVRLVNQFQHKDIREKALAAKARRQRQLRDPGTDAYAILENDIEAIRRTEDTEALVEELVALDWWRDYLEAVRDMGEEEEFKHIADDQKRLEELGTKPSELDEASDELVELRKHLTSYQDRLEEKVKEAQQPRREALAAKGLDGLLDLVREARIEAQANDEFMDTYSIHQMLMGTLRHPHGPARWDSLDQMKDAAPEVIDALRRRFEELENAQQEGLTKNS